MKAKITAEVERQEKELLNLMFTRANITEDMLIKDAIARWINKNLDLLNETEIKKYKELLIINKPKYATKRK